MAAGASTVDGWNINQKKKRGCGSSGLFHPDAQPSVALRKNARCLPPQSRRKELPNKMKKYKYFLEKSNVLYTNDKINTNRSHLIKKAWISKS